MRLADCAIEPTRPMDDRRPPFRLERFRVSLRRRGENKTPLQDVSEPNTDITRLPAIGRCAKIRR